MGECFFSGVFKKYFFFLFLFFFSFSLLGSTVEKIEDVTCSRESSLLSPLVI